MARGLAAEELRHLYEKFAPVIHRRARALLGRDADAWDVVHDVFERMLTAGEHFRGDATALTYVYRATTNRCLNVLRARALRESGGASIQPSEAGLGVEAANFIGALASRLDPRSLTVAVLHFVDGLTQDEVARTLGLSRKTVVREISSLRETASALAATPTAKPSDG